MIKEKLALQIALVDDDKDDIELFQSAVNDTNQSIHLIAFGDCLESVDYLLKIFVERLPEFIFLDIRMKPIDGFTCLKAIKDHEKLSHIPVVIYAHAITPQDKMKMTTLGASDFLEKPVNMTDLTRYLNKLTTSKGQNS